MTGGPGADLFRYLSASAGQDSITDFTAGVDKIQVVASGFGNLPAGALQANNFVSSATPAATQAAPQFLYNTTTGMLAFDADGTGGGAAVESGHAGGQAGAHGGRSAGGGGLTDESVILASALKSHTRVYPAFRKRSHPRLLAYRRIAANSCHFRIALTCRSTGIL